MLSTQPDANGQLLPALDRAHHLARAGLEEARRAIAALRDEDLPGPDRLEQLAADFELDSNVYTSLQITGIARDLDSETSPTIYRVVQEALTNIRKHATPDRVECCSAMTPTNPTVLIADDQRIVREGLTMVLGPMPGVEIVGSARDGEEAITLVERLQPESC